MRSANTVTIVASRRPKARATARAAAKLRPELGPTGNPNRINAFVVRSAS